MQDIKQRELKMQEKRKQTPWRDFVREICSRYPVNFYKNNGLLSIYPETSRSSKIVSFDTFHDYDNIAQEGYDGKDFFALFKNIFYESHLPNTARVGKNSNTDFADSIVGAKNVYLAFTVAYDCQNVFYSLHIKDGTNDVLNSTMVWQNSAIVYHGYSVISSYKIFYSRFIVNSSDIWFSTNLMGCKECLLCNDLENKSYCIQNQQYNKEEYLQKKHEILSQKKDFHKLFQNIFAYNGKNFASDDLSDCIFANMSNSITDGRLVYNVKEGHNLVLVGGKEGDENVYDAMLAGSPFCNNMYGIANVGASEHIYNAVTVNGSSHIYYSFFCISCSYCLGCVGLTNKNFCILNKEYSKEEWFALANKIFTQMDKDGTLGSFFPGSTNPFYFNDTIAYLIDDSFTKEEVTKEGYLRRDEEIRVDMSPNAEVITTKDLDQYQGCDDTGERVINTEILKKVIRDDKGNYYRIVPMELEFLQKYGLPLPEIHRLERIKLGFKFK